MSKHCVIEREYRRLVTGHLFTSKNAAGVQGGSALHFGQNVAVSCFQAGQAGVHNHLLTTSENW